MRTPKENKGLPVELNKAALVCVRLLTDDAIADKKAGDIVYVDAATAHSLIAGYYAEMAEE